ncbi:MAG: hypothetical protein K8T10_04645 [Candidatus Eremiobacteraeota bacterium]|nr:hypothetical protein [Candidatus Eremiobacteraeota bacterium]
MKMRHVPAHIGNKVISPFKKAGKKVVEKVKDGVEFIDDYTSPREETAGNFKKASYFQACFTGATEGFYVMGLPGVAMGAVPAAVGVAVSNKTGKESLGVVAGVISGAAVGAGVGAIVTGPAGVVAGAITGAILGAMETFRGSSKSETRDGGGNANMISAPFIPGPAKMAGGIGSAIGTRMKSKTAKSVVGGIAAAAIGGTLAAIGFAPVSIPVAIAACGAAGVLGPIMGPRYSQLFRNLSNDIGKLVGKAAKKIGLVKEGKDMDPNKKNIIGAIPSSFVKEGLRGFALSDGNIGKMLLGGVMESIEQAHIFLTQKKGKDQAKKASQAPKTITQGIEAKDSVKNK